MNILLLLAIFWPAIAGVATFFLPAARENRSLRGILTNAALALEVLLVLLLCFAQGQSVK